MKLYLLAIAYLISSNLFAQQQDTCASWTDEQLQVLDPQAYQKRQDLEAFTATYISSQSGSSARLVNTNGVITIPVVVHILHRGEQVGVQTNISDAEIQSQIDVLNEDYARLNADAVNTPSRFLSVAGDAKIRFQLACIDPNGNYTNGVVRKNSNRIFGYHLTKFINGGIDDDATGIKNSTHGGDNPWPSSTYLNIWVTDLFQDNQNTITTGWGTFPDRYFTRPDLDGIVVLYSYFGRSGADQGRTLTHEVGHWLNVRHIWGDRICGDDLVADTPQQYDKNFDCPTGFHYSYCSNIRNIGDMYMNYMDYTDGSCKNIFTIGQIARMRATFLSGTAGRQTQLENYFKLIPPPPGGIHCVGTVGLQNPLCLSPVTWSVISGPAILPTGSGGTQYVNVKATGTGTVTLRASAGNYVTDLSFQVSDAGPTAISSVDEEENVVRCRVINYLWTIDGAASADNFVWTYRNITRGTSFQPYQVTTNNYTNSPNGRASCDLIEVKVDATNSCSSVVQSYTFYSDLCPTYLQSGCNPNPDPEDPTFQNRTSTNDLQISPNPTSNLIRIKLKKNIDITKTPSKLFIEEIKIYSKMGLLLKTFRGNRQDNMVISLSDLPSDTYVASVFDGEKWMSVQLVKQ